MAFSLRLGNAERKQKLHFALRFVLQSKLNLEYSLGITTGGLPAKMHSSLSGGLRYSVRKGKYCHFRIAFLARIHADFDTFLRRTANVNNVDRRARLSAVADSASVENETTTFENHLVLAFATANRLLPAFARRCAEALG